MFVKIFEQILDSSIAEKYELRHFFEDMLKLSDVTGAVDMTAEAIARRINLPLEKVVPMLAELGRPDPKSRTQKHEGRRVVPLDSHRDWGWLIVNYEHYRSIRDQSDRRAYNRDAKRKERRKNGGKGVARDYGAGEHRYVKALEANGQEFADRQFDEDQKRGVE